MHADNIANLEEFSYVWKMHYKMSPALKKDTKK